MKKYAGGFRKTPFYHYIRVNASAAGRDISRPAADYVFDRFFRFYAIS